MRSVIIFLAGLLTALPLTAHPWKPSHYVIVDTDGGTDDMKAISMLLASPDIRVLAVTVSPGALSERNTYIKVKSLLNSYFHQGIPVGINRESGYTPEEFPVALQSIWGPEQGIDPDRAPDYSELIEKILEAEKTKITFISLGSMSTAYLSLKNVPLFRTQVRDFIWSFDGTSETDGFNYNIDRKASAGILKQEIPVKIVRKPPVEDNEFYGAGFIRTIGMVKTRYADKIFVFLNSEPARNHSFSFAATDEMVPLFLHYPDLFLNKTMGNVTNCFPSEAEGLKDAMIKILKGETVSRNQVIKEMPADPAFYFDDIEPDVTTIINRYGPDEWASGVLANELHRHLGVFAIVGVKMGIRAREYFNTGVDEFEAVSYAGDVPPLSCMNDGLQVSTGATPGHGLLSVRTDTVVRPSVDFTYLDNKIRLTLKEDIAAKISSELKEINFIYGLDSNIYWELVRKNSIKYWLSLDRHEIFDIEVLR